MGRDGRLIVGGEDETDPAAHEDSGKLKRKCENIATRLEALMPSLAFEIDYSGSGAFGETASGLPNIVPVLDMHHAWAVMGFGGNGIIYWVIASQIVSAAVRGAPDADADLYHP